ncbi:class IIb bacteriocin, lactobin A/cerein 7B family [Marinilabilia rubra]|uniref:Class IIb bacteriocin, lactobin A/cerein 7B family n=1 Tax=Marinilabilia rubra TaxID=2162893 RepID=A0A2U2B8E9_9BACT|nr:class IIb bacteriocin, lactobin A/cerein 7B family [Marinilabilia rubra]PWD99340.1 hypothetical protein DDZ16_10025 [Marinilabilia rubra]
MNLVNLESGFEFKELTQNELQETDGGIVVALCCVALVCLAGCTVNVNTGSGNINNSTEASADSTNVNVGHGSGNNL